MKLAGQRVRTKHAAAAIDSGTQAGRLLAWYDRHRRVLPWRARPGERPDPYRVWLSEIMLQQTTTKAVAPYYARMLARWPDIESLAAAPLADVLTVWAGLGYYARARNLHACAKVLVERHGADFPRDEKVLRGLPGIGPYTAAAIAAIAFDERATPIDGNVERVITRLFAIEEALPAGKPVVRRLVETITPDRRCGDFAQALMDLGATICTPARPACALCPWMDICAARKSGEAEMFPRKARKPTGRLRCGAAFVVMRADGAILLRTRPANGLLGGMAEVPTTEWTRDFDERRALPQAPLRQQTWHRLPGHVAHTFTHFPLQLVVYAAQVPAGTHAPEGCRWVALAHLASEALPNVMRKVIAHAIAQPTGKSGRIARSA